MSSGAANRREGFIPYNKSVVTLCKANRRRWWWPPCLATSSTWNLLLSTRNGIPSIPVDALPGNLDLHLANHQYKYVPSLKSSVFSGIVFIFSARFFLKSARFRSRTSFLRLLTVVSLCESMNLKSPFPWRECEWKCLIFFGPTSEACKPWSKILFHDLQSFEIKQDQETLLLWLFPPKPIADLI